MVERKGVGYMIEAIVSMMILLVFVLGNSVSSPVQDWGETQDQITANDLTYTLKETGDLEKFMVRNEPGSLETTVSTLTPRDLEISGSIEGLPLDDIYMGFHAPEDERHTLELKDDITQDECYQNDELEELEERAGLEGLNPQIERTEGSGPNGVYLYFVDQNPDTSGFDESLWVDNGTRCQFADSDGPILQDEFYLWGDKDEDYEYYEFKDIDVGGQEFTTYEATQVYRIKQKMNKPVNSVETSAEFETFSFDEKNIHEYDIIGLRNNVDEFNHGGERAQLEEFLDNKPVLLLTDIQEEQLEEGLLGETGFEHVNTGREGNLGTPLLGTNSDGLEIETYFNGLDGDLDSLSVEPQGQISSSNSDRFMEEDHLLYDSNQRYTLEEFYAENNSMEQVDNLGVIDGVPTSRCVEEYGEEAVTIGDIEFATDHGTETYEAISTQMAGDHGDCGELRAVNIDLGSGFSDLGPLLPGESVEIEDRTYTVVVDGEDTVEFLFQGNDEVEILNYRESFEGFSSDRLARLPHQEEYNKQDRRLIASMIYWLAREDTEFGEDSYDVSSSVVGGINHETYMSYRASLRWE